MRWEDEAYVRVYTRETPEWAALSWEARAVFHETIKKVDRVGLIAIGKSGLRGLAGLLRMPLEVVDRGLNGDDGLLADGCIVAVDGGYLMPNYMEAQQAKQTDRLRKQEQRARERAAKLDGARSPVEEPGPPVTNRDSGSQGVTESHDLSHAVTGGHTRSQDVTLSIAEHSGAEQSRAGTEERERIATGVAPRPRPYVVPKKRPSEKLSHCPDVEDPEIDAWLSANAIPALDSSDGVEVEKFLNHHAKKGSKWASWRAAWRTWARSEFFHKHSGSSPLRRKRSTPNTVPDPGEPPPLPESVRQAMAAAPPIDKQSVLGLLGMAMEAQ